MTGRISDAYRISVARANSGSKKAFTAFRQCKEKSNSLFARLLIRMIGQPIGSGTFGDRFFGEYYGIKVTIKEMKRRNESLKENNATRRKFCTRLEYCPALAITKVYHFFWGYAWTRTIFTDHTISRLKGGKSHPPQSHQNENTEQNHNSGDLCRCLPSC